MAYSELVALRIRDALGGSDIVEKRMMGGLIFMLNGHMVVGLKTLKTGGEQFMFRVGKDAEDAALGIVGTRPMIHGGRRMTGFLFIDEADCGDDAFARLVATSKGYVETLPAK